MLRDDRKAGDRTVSGVFVSKGEKPVISEKVVYCTNDMETMRNLETLQLPCIYLEFPGNIPDYDAAFVWQEKGMPDKEYLELVWRRFHHLPLIIAETRHLLIRESVLEDNVFFQSLYQEEKENQDVEKLQKESEQILDSYIKMRYPLYGYGLWSILDKASGCVIGRAGVEEIEEESVGRLFGCQELSYLIASDFRGKGYATECCCAIISYLREHTAIQEIYLRTSKENIASQKIAKKLGFRKLESIEGYRKILYVRSIDR